MTALVGIDFGGPRAAALQQNRLLLVGSTAVPDLLLASKSGAWTDYSLTSDDGTGTQVATESDGFWVEQVSARSNSFHAVAQQEGLFLFGDIGEATVPAGPLTGAQIQIRENSWFGSEIGRLPVIVRGLVCFLQAGRRDVRAIRWTEQERKYEAPSLRELAGNVFWQAVEMAWGRSRASEGDSLYIVDDRGIAAVCTLRQSAPETAWSRWAFGSGFAVGCANAGQREVFLVVRPDGSISVEAPETRTPQGDALIDLAFTVTPTREPQTIPYYLTGVPISVSWRLDRGAGVPVEWEQSGVVLLQPGGLDWTVSIDPDDGQPVFTAEDRGQVLRERIVTQETAFQAEQERADIPSNWPIRLGHRYTAVFETLPFAARTQTGTRRGVTRSRIFGAYLDFERSAPRELSVNGRLLQPRENRSNMTDRVESFRIGPSRGWRRRTTLNIRMYTACQVAGLFYRASG